MHLHSPPQRLPALTIVLPRPQLQRTRSTLSSAVSSPHTPRTSSCNSSIFFAPNNRNSTDSWNSSNAADELEWDWKPEQVLLLSRTLDALPAHLVTPFNGPIPPSNLLDKIARGVAQAKGPIEWPHSIRATRVKLIELSRTRAKEDQAQQIIPQVHNELDIDDAYYPDHTGKSYGIKRPLYRQSSMDFMNVADLKENDSITRLSDRLQRNDRINPNQGYHPYSRRTPRAYPRRLSSPPRPGDVPSLINPSTPSSSTLNTLSSFSSHPARALRRSPSTLSSSASSISMMSVNGGALPDPRVQRVRRSESFCPPTPPPKDLKPLFKENNKDISPPAAGLKRAPSFGATAQEVRRDRHHLFGGVVNGNESQGDKYSSDEEEKIRSRTAKKLRVKVGGDGIRQGGGGLVASPSAATSSPAPPALASPIASLVLAQPVGTPKKTKGKAKGARIGSEKTSSPKSPTPKQKQTSDIAKGAERKHAADGSVAKEGRKTRPGPMNLQRNPSIFGAELPHLREGRDAATSPHSRSLGSRVTGQSSLNPRLTNITTTLPVKVIPSADGTPVSPAGPSPKVKTLRRVRRLAPARRISFGSLVAPGEDADGEAEDDEGGNGGRERQWERQRQRELGQLGSAFQLQ